MSCSSTSGVYSETDLLRAAASVAANRPPGEDYDDAFQDAVVAILEAGGNLRHGVFAAQRDAYNRRAKRQRRSRACLCIVGTRKPQLTALETAGQEPWDGRSFQSVQFDPSLNR